MIQAQCQIFEAQCASLVNAALTAAENMKKRRRECGSTLLHMFGDTKLSTLAFPLAHSDFVKLGIHDPLKKITHMR